MQDKAIAESDAQAAKPVQQRIALKTSLGKCKLAISALLQNDKMNEAALLAMSQLTFHVWPSKAYAKKESYKRESAFSKELAAHMKRHGLAVLGKIFEDIKIDVSEEIVKSPEERAREEFIALSLEGDQLESAMKTWRAKNLKTAEKPAEKAAEDNREEA